MATGVDQNSDITVIAARRGGFKAGSATLDVEHRQSPDQTIAARLAVEQGQNAARTTSTGHPFPSDRIRRDGILAMWVAKSRAEAAGNETEAARIAADIADWGRRMGIR
jgi:hypothetical protein